MSKDYNITIVGCAFNWLLMHKGIFNDIDVSEFLEYYDYNVSDYSDLDSVTADYYDSISENVFEYNGKTVKICQSRLTSGSSSYNSYEFKPYVDDEVPVETLAEALGLGLTTPVEAIVPPIPEAVPSASYVMTVKEFIEANMNIPAYQLTYLINRQYGTAYSSSSVVSMKSAVTKKRNRNR